jgi:hypothetical protein
MPNKWIPLADLNGANGGDPAPEWIRLSDSRRRLVTAYVASNYSKTEAVKAVYTCGTIQCERTTINRSFGNATVKAFLAVHMGQTPQDAFREELQRIASSTKGISMTRLQVLKMLAKQVGADTSALNEIDSLSEGVVLADRVVQKNGRKLRQVVTDLGAADSE